MEIKNPSETAGRVCFVTHPHCHQALGLGDQFALQEGEAPCFEGGREGRSAGLSSLKSKKGTRDGFSGSFRVVVHMAPASAWSCQKQRTGQVVWHQAAILY